MSIRFSYKHIVSILLCSSLLYSINIHAQKSDSTILNASEKNIQRKILVDALETAFPNSIISPSDIEKYLFEYLTEAGDAFKEFFGSQGKNEGKGIGSYKRLGNQVSKDSALVLGKPGESSRSTRIIDNAAERMKLGAKKQWQYYSCESLHTRRSNGILGKQEHLGVVNMVRVTLPKEIIDEDFIINTPLGEVIKKDHLVFSNESLRKYVLNLCYPKGPDSLGISYYKMLPAFERIDLITPARYHGIRFAPIAIYMVFAKHADKTPIFYMMEGGNGLGFCEVLYISPVMDPNKPILMDAGYQPTSFSNQANYYLSRTSFNSDTPTAVSIKIYTRQEALSIPFAQMGKENDSVYHFEIEMLMKPSSLEDVASLDNFVPPVKQLFQAFLRIQDLLDRGVPPTDNGHKEVRYDNLVYKIAKEVYKGADHACEQRKLNKLKERMTD